MKKQDIKDLMQFFDTTGLTKLKIKEGEFEVELEKKQEVLSVATVAPQVVNTPAVTKEPMPAPVASTCTVADLPSIKSPMVGTFYKAPSPDSAPFAKAGQVIKKGQTVAIIEAMKIMNEIEAEFDCKIVSVLVEDGQPIEYDMPLFSVEKL